MKTKNQTKSEKQNKPKVTYNNREWHVHFSKKDNLHQIKNLKEPQSRFNSLERHTVKQNSSLLIQPQYIYLNASAVMLMFSTVSLHT